MSFQKRSKRPLNPPPLIYEKICSIFLIMDTKPSKIGGTIQLMTKMTITYKFHAHKALFKVPKSATEYSCCSFPLRYLHVLTDILFSSSFRSKPRSVRGCYRHNTKSYSKKDALKQVLSNLGVTRGIFNLFFFLRAFLITST